MCLSPEVWLMQGLQKDLDMKWNFSVNCGDFVQSFLDPEGVVWGSVCSLLLYHLGQFGPSTVVALE